MGIMHHNDLRHATTATDLLKVKLPASTPTYSPISHKQMMDWAQSACDANDFAIIRKDYIQGNGGRQMAGFYHLQMGDDEMAGQLAFINSYDKRFRASVASGATVTICANGIILAEEALRRLHTGKAEMVVRDFFFDALHNQAEKFEKLTEQRESLKLIPLSKREMAELAGRLFVEEKLLTSYEINEVARQINNPSFDYGGNNNTGWEFYNHLTVALKNESPMTYMRKHGEVNNFVTDELLVG